VSDQSEVLPAVAGRLAARAAVKDVVLGVVGIAGVLALAWVICAAALGLSVVIFQTGSMSPTMPTGAAAIVRTIPASEIAIGDVVTVTRVAGDLPVTHRVVSIEEADAADPTRTVILKGDANAVADLAPYTVSTVELVLASAPGLGTVITLLRSPFALAVTTLVVATLCIWAFWPQRHAALGTHRAPTGRAARAS